MADVQCEKGFTKVANELLEVVAQQKFNGTQFKIIMTIWRFTYGFGRKEHEMSLTFISKATNTHKQQIKTELAKLIDMKVVLVKEESTHSTSRVLSFNKNYDEWNCLQVVKPITGSESTYTTGSESTYTTGSESTYQERKIKENIKESIPHKKIVDYLNEKTGKSFSAQTKKTRDLISARWKEGHSFDDFVAVIDYFSTKWKGVIFSDGTPAEKYLQPSTLFNGKFDERVNEAKMAMPDQEQTERKYSPDAYAWAGKVVELREKLEKAKTKDEKERLEIELEQLESERHMYG